MASKEKLVGGLIMAGAAVIMAASLWISQGPHGTKGEVISKSYFPPEIVNPACKANCPSIYALTVKVGDKVQQIKVRKADYDSVDIGETIEFVKEKKQ